MVIDSTPSFFLNSVEKPGLLRFARNDSGEARNGAGAAKASNVVRALAPKGKSQSLLR
jgi:hypothetical protein